MNPIARKEGITVEDIQGESVVYDCRRHRAHCLNKSAAAVWRSCDGHNSLKDIAARLHKDLGLPDDLQLVHVALDQLEAEELVEHEAVPRHEPLPSRLDIGHRLSIGTLALPLVTSLTIAAAGSRRPNRRPGKSFFSSTRLS